MVQRNLRDQLLIDDKRVRPATTENMDAVASGED